MRDSFQHEVRNGGVSVVSSWSFAVLLAGGALARGQQPTKFARHGYLSSNDPATESTRSDAIGPALRERGYVEGQNIATEYRYAEGKADRAR